MIIQEAFNDLTILQSRQKSIGEEKNYHLYYYHLHLQMVIAVSFNIQQNP